MPAMTKWSIIEMRTIITVSISSLFSYKYVFVYNKYLFFLLSFFYHASSLSYSLVMYDKNVDFYITIFVIGYQGEDIT